MTPWRPLPLLCAATRRPHSHTLHSDTSLPPDTISLETYLLWVYDGVCVVPDSMMRLSDHHRSYPRIGCRVASLYPTCSHDNACSTQSAGAQRDQHGHASLCAVVSPRRHSVVNKRHRQPLATITLVPAPRSQCSRAFRFAFTHTTPLRAFALDRAGAAQARLGPASEERGRAQRVSARTKTRDAQDGSCPRVLSREANQDDRSQAFESVDPGRHTKVPRCGT